MKETLKFLISKTFLKHLGIAVGSLIILLIITLTGLDLYTHHGEAIKVPDFTGLTESQFGQMIENTDLRYEIIDSVHVATVAPGVVVEQSPKPGSFVKSNRNIFFTINAMKPEQILLPRVTDYSLRNAQSILESYGLKVGRFIYMPSEYKNLVLGIHYKGKPIEPGTALLRGSAVDLLVGRGLSDASTNLPNLIGMTIGQAKNFLEQASLNLGAIAYDTTITTHIDTVMAVIWKQDPDASSAVSLYLGSSVDIWVTSDSTFQVMQSLSPGDSADTKGKDESESFE
jgi:eukaryotic-like serine/threonine-protein kinase